MFNYVCLSSVLIPDDHSVKIENFSLLYRNTRVFVNDWKLIFSGQMIESRDSVSNLTLFEKTVFFTDSEFDPNTASKESVFIIGISR